MSDTGTDLVNESKDDSQPTDVVTTEVEANTSESQLDDTETFELHIDDEGDPDKTPDEKQPDYEMARKAFREREEKRKRKEAEEAERKALHDRIDRLESDKSKSSDKPPTLADCDYDEDEFQKKVAEYYSKPKQSTKANEASSNSQPTSANPEIEIKSTRQEDDIRKKLPKYDDIKTDLAMRFANDGVNPDAVMNDIQAICHSAGLDSATAIVALGKVKGAYEGLKQHAGNAVAAYKYLEKISAKVKLNSSKKVETVPEPTLNSSGGVNNSAASVDKLRKQWLANSSSSNYRAYMSAKNKLKGN